MYDYYKEKGFPDFFTNNEVLLKAADEVAGEKRLQQFIIDFIRAGMRGRSTSTIKEQIEGAYLIAITYPETPARGQWIKEKLDPAVIQIIEILRVKH